MMFILSDLKETHIEANHEMSGTQNRHKNRGKRSQLVFLMSNLQITSHAVMSHVYFQALKKTLEATYRDLELPLN